MTQYIFKPTDRNMLMDYPELSEYDEFGDLKNDELTFIWHYVFDRSDLDIHAFTDKQYRERAAQKAFPQDKSRIAEFSSGAFEPRIRAAIEKMKSFNPTARFRAKAMVEKLFSDFETINKKSLMDMIDTDEVAKYIGLKIKIQSVMPDLVKQIERGYGVTEEAKSQKDKRKKSFADQVHEHMDR